jgi:hypothetical protein
MSVSLDESIGNEYARAYALQENDPIPGDSIVLKILSALPILAVFSAPAVGDLRDCIRAEKNPNRLIQLLHVRAEHSIATIFHGIIVVAWGVASSVAGFFTGPILVVLGATLLTLSTINLTLCTKTIKEIRATGTCPKQPPALL